MASREQVNRLLALVPYLLQSRGRADLAATAAVFGVSPAQLVDDLKVLWYCGLPGGLPGDLIEVDVDGLDTGTIRLGNADYLARPLRFTPDEALSLLVAVSAVRALAGDDLSAAVDSAREKLSRAAGSAAPAGVAVSVSSGTAQVRQQLIDAIAARAVVRPGVARPVRRSNRDGSACATATPTSTPGAWSGTRGGPSGSTGSRPSRRPGSRPASAATCRCSTAAGSTPAPRRPR
jgi:proteasome accessory factor C